MYLYVWECKVMLNIIILFEGNGKIFYMYKWFYMNIESSKGGDLMLCCNDDVFCNYFLYLGDWMKYDVDLIWFFYLCKYCLLF